MTPRERLLTALDHREPDRVPIDLGGNQTGIHKFAYRKLIDLLGLKEDIVIMDAVQQLAKPSEAVLERLGVDTRYVWAGGAKSFKGGIVQRRREGRLWHDLTDEFGITWSMPDDYPYYMDISHSPLAGMSIGQIGDYPFPRATTPPASRACGTARCICGARRPIPSSAAYRASSTRSAGTCAGWRTSSST